MSKTYSPSSAAGGQPPTKKKASTPPTPVLSKTDPQRNDQEDIRECICSLGKKIRKDFKKSGKIQSSVRELEKDIQSLIDDIVKEEKKQDDTKESVTKDKTKEKDKSPKDTKQKTSVKEEEIDLLSLFKKMRQETIKLNSDLVTARKESKLICEKIHSTGKDLGIDVVDDKQHDVNSSKETITCILAENRKLSNTLNKLNKEIETLDMQEKDASQDQHKKNTKLNKKEDKDKKKNKTSKDSVKQHSDLSDESPFTVFKAFDRHVPRMIEILNNESLLREQKRALNYHLNNAQFISDNIKTTIDNNGEIRDSGKGTENKTTSNVNTTKIKNQQKQPKNEKERRATEVTNTPDKSHDNLTDTIKKLDQILTFIANENNTLNHQQR
ncbi:Hypothetical predicted protein [Mytilus galloprovincialis]|uniref:Uncharacterized protein n=1 Tax=Mytilus galloprovincialis TaxID=29158 RepID=A0A8B6CVW8_MYTGA|nr:Hypothetical predicted protein [Mytilus galloprovincialis]